MVILYPAFFALFLLFFLVGCKGNNDATTELPIEPEQQVRLSKVEHQALPEDGTLLVPLDVVDVTTPLDAVDFKVSSSNPQLISEQDMEIVEENGKFSLRLSPSENQSGSATIEVGLNVDNGGAPVLFSVTVMPVEDPPVWADLADLSGVEDEKLVSPRFTVRDPDTGPEALTFELSSSNKALFADFNMSVKREGGEFYLELKPSRNTSGKAVVSLEVSDGQSILTQTFNVEVAAVNDPPSIEPIDDVVRDEDSPFPQNKFVIMHDIDTAIGDLQVSVTSSNPSLVAASVVGTAFSLFGKDKGYDIALEVPEDAHGQAQIEVTVADGTHTVKQQFSYQVNPVNDAPTVGSIANAELYGEGKSHTANFEVDDIDTDLTALNLSVETSDPALLPLNAIGLSGEGAQRAITLTPTAGNYGAAEITVVASDGELSTRRTFTLTVKPEVVADFSLVSKKIAVGRSGACAIVNNEVRCWGNGAYRKVSVASLIVNPRQVVVGADHACALSDAGVHCWGDTFAAKTTVPSLNQPYFLAAGDRHTCALDDDGVKCWGYYAELWIPGDLDNPVMITAAGEHTCALTNPGVVCWGGSAPSAWDKPNSLQNPRAVLTNIEEACVLDDAGMHCWGKPNSKNISNYSEGTTTLAMGGWYVCDITDGALHCDDRYTPDNLSHPSEVAISTGYGCALDDFGINCWGYNYSDAKLLPRELNSRPVTHANPSKVVAGSGASCAISDLGLTCWGEDGNVLRVPEAANSARDIDLGHLHACALTETDVVCWGSGSFNLSTPPEILNPVAISVGFSHACAIGDAGVSCWGDNTFGQLNVPQLVNPVKVSAGWETTCAIDDKGLHCWGRDTATDLLEDLSTPPAGLVNPRDIDTAEYNACTIDDAGVHCWGWQGSGKLDFQSVTGVQQIGAGAAYACAMTASEVVCSGSSFNGETQPPALSNPRQLSVGDKHACAIDDNGVHCWGGDGAAAEQVPPFLEIIN